MEGIFGYIGDGDNFFGIKCCLFGWNGEKFYVNCFFLILVYMWLVFFGIILKWMKWFC